MERKDEAGDDGGEGEEEETDNGVESKGCSTQDWQQQSSTKLNRVQLN